MIKRFIRRAYYLSIILGASILFAILGTIILGYFRVQTIELTGTKSLIGISKYSNEIMFLIDGEEIIDVIKKQNAQVDSVLIQKKYPHTLLITVIESASSVILKVGGGWYILNNEGKIIKKMRSKPKSKLPVMQYFTLYPYESYKIGDTLSSEEIQYGAYFAKALTSIGEKNITVAINQLFMIVLRNNSHEFLITTKKNKEDQEALIRSIVRSFRIEGKKYKKIDVRFSKPVVQLEINQTIEKQ